MKKINNIEELIELLRELSKYTDTIKIEVIKDILEDLL